MKRYFFLEIILINFILIHNSFAQQDSLPFNVKTDLFDYSQPSTLGLSFIPNAKTYTIYSPNEESEKYSNGVVLIEFKGYLYAQWQSSSRDEDANDTWVAYSRSNNDSIWTKPMILAPKWENGIYTSGGWWTYDSLLVAYINVWPNDLNPKGGFTEYLTSDDGINWSKMKSLLNNSGKSINGIFEQDPHKLPNGRIIGAVHEQPGMIVTPYYTDDPAGIKGWTKGIMKNLPHKGTVSRELEPSWFFQKDGKVVMIFRDQNSTFKKLTSVSSDEGETWSTPVLTNMPDSRSKQCAGNLPDGTAFIINNPTNSKDRFPLVITLSKNGKYFDKAFLLRAGGSDLQPLRFSGKYKRIGYSYPKAMISGKYLYVSYSTNKEDVEFTKVLIEALKY